MTFFGVFSAVLAATVFTLAFVFCAYYIIRDSYDAPPAVLFGAGGILLVAALGVYVGAQ